MNIYNLFYLDQRNLASRPPIPSKFQENWSLRVVIALVVAVAVAATGPGAAATTTCLARLEFSLIEHDRV